MRHRCRFRQLGRVPSHRSAMLRNMAASLVMQERISTTLHKAKELRSVVDQLITLGKRGDLHARRQASSFFYDDAATLKVFSELANRFKDRPGGYTRILRKGPRRGDGAFLAVIELVDNAVDKKSAADSEKKARKTAPRKEKEAVG